MAAITVTVHFSTVTNVSHYLVVAYGEKVTV
jgi:hypothetical protein